jgi:CTP:molybdopterin cytidylyltransferase MocA
VGGSSGGTAANALAPRAPPGAGPLSPPEKLPGKPAASPAGGPKFSVIITAYDRRTYLPRAIDSVLSQSVPREEYEIIVVKNFEDPEADRRIREHSLIGIYRTEVPLGIHLKAALERSHGELVALLNDDDLWEPDRLAEVARRFAEDPALGFHATSYTVVDEENRPIDAARDRFTAIARFEAQPGARFHVGPRSPPSELDAFVRANPGSDSTITIRSATLRRFARELETLPSSVDTFMLTCGLLSGFDLEIEYRALTRLRVHSENMSRATDASLPAYLSKYARTMGGFAAATAHMMEMASREGNAWWHDRLEAKYRALDHFARMAGGTLRRSEAMREFATEVRHAGFSRPGLVGSELLYVASPGLSRTVNFLVGRRIAGA